MWKNYSQQTSLCKKCYGLSLILWFNLNYDIMICNTTYACWFDIWVMISILMIGLYVLDIFIQCIMCWCAFCFIKLFFVTREIRKTISFLNFIKKVGSTLDMFKMQNLKLSWRWMLATSMLAIELSFVWH